ncbi:MAG: MBL fold metallo-hydrolase [Gaiellaceae bacterium]
MPHFICVTCGVQHAESSEPPAACAVCEDERQYVPDAGQAWTTLEELRRDHRADVRDEEPGLTGIGCEPEFAIGQRGLLVEGVMWDCTPLLDDELVREVEARGGLGAIAISHPHFHSSIVEWSRAFGGAPVYVHSADRDWVQRPDSCLRFWEGETLELPGGLTAVRCGGHFAGASVLHWPAGADGRGALLTGDTIQVVPDRRYVSFMYSYPNMIPLGAGAIRRIAAAVEPFEFDRIYGAWWGRVVRSDAKAAVRRSAERYLTAIAEPS